MNENDNISPVEAQQALESVEKLETAGWRRAVPARWFGAGVSILVGSLFAVYALEDPSSYIVYPILGLVIFLAVSREKAGAYGRNFAKAGRSLVASVLFAVVLLIIFFGSVYMRRAFDAAWVSLVAGLLVGLFIFIASENERRAYLAKTKQGEAK